MAKSVKDIAKNTYIDMEMEDGQVLKLTLTFIALLQLKRKHPEQYQDYGRIMSKGPQDEFDTLTVLYTGYLCGLMMENGDTDGCMDYEEFLSITTPDREYIGKLAKALMNPKKATASADRS